MASEMSAQMNDADRLAGRLVEGMPVTHRRLDVAGVSTSLLEAGDGPPLVLLHGQGGFAEIMAPFIRMTADRHRVVLPDLPGMGRSEIRSGALDGGRVTEWLAELIAKTCDQPSTLLGASLGGSIALRFAVARGAELRRLVLVDSGSLGPFRPPPGLLFALIRLVRKPDLRAIARLQRQIFHDADRVRAAAGDRIRAVEDYQLDRARQPSVSASNRTLPASDRDEAGAGRGASADRRAGGTHLGTSRSCDAAPLRRAGERRVRLAAVPDRGRRHVPFVEQPKAFEAALRSALEG